MTVETQAGGGIIGNPNARQVILALTLSVTTILAARGLQWVNDENGRRIANPVPGFGGPETYLAWGVLLIFLVAMADVPQTGALAASFAWLILLAVLYVYGVGAAENLTLMMNSRGEPTYVNNGQPNSGNASAPIAGRGPQIR